MKKITMMDNLTLYVDKSEYKIEIDEKFTKVSSLDEIEDLEQSLPGFFDVESISRENNKIYLVYGLPNGYEPMEKAKKYVPVIKLQLIKNLLDIDPLFNADGMTYLDLNNVFFKSFNEIKVLYRSNGYLPFHSDLSMLEQYKLFVLGFFSNKYSYKRFLINKDNLLRKENNEFMFAVNATDSFSDLKILIDKELEKEQSNFYEKIQFQENSRKKGVKRKIYIGVIGTLLLALIFVGSMKQIEKNVAADFKKDMAAIQLENELTLALSSGDINKAIELMEKKGDDSANIADLLIKAGRFDEAIALDKTVEKDVVSYLYKIDQKEKILELESDSPFINFEKEIVNFDAENLITKSALIEDKDTLKRLSFAFIEHDNFEYAKDVLEKLKLDSSEIFNLSKSESEEIDKWIKKTDLEIQVKNLNLQISSLRQRDTFSESEEESLKKENEIKELDNTLVGIQKELIKLDEDLGMDDA